MMRDNTGFNTVNPVSLVPKYAFIGNEKNIAYIQCTNNTCFTTST